MERISTYRHSHPLGLVLLGAALLAAPACTGDDGDRGPAGPGGSTTTPTDLSQGDETPGLAVLIQSLTGGSGPMGRFRAGDRMTVNYRLEKDDGSDWDIAEIGSGRALVSGPTFSYQRVLEEQRDVHTTSKAKADGSYSYTFPDPIPATYLAPFNDTASFGTDDGELTGQPLLDGTYTLGMTFSWNYTVDGASKNESANATMDFLFGGATVLEHREVVKIENCNRCHTELRTHGGRREQATLCVLCHTAGSEDRNNPAVAGGTPDVSIDFRVMIHKIHSGVHLPSVQGVATNPDGSRDYTATPMPYQVAGFSLADFSEVAFPAWPHALVATPRDQGYSALSSTDKAKEDAIRTGPSNCAVCHGDPDGPGGPLTAPAQGDLYMTMPTRQACGSCHDDVHWGQDYTSNGQTMPAQANNANCILCHEDAGNSLAVFDAHLHPLKDPTFNTGLNFDLQSVVEAGTNDGDGTIDVGEKMAITLHITDDLGAKVSPGSISSPSVVISGPTDNYNVLLNTTIPSAALTGVQPFTVNVPMRVQLERLGESTAALDSFTSAFAPHWNVAGGTTDVMVRTATAGGDSTLSAAAVAPQNWVDVADGTGFDRNDYIVVDDGTAAEEYMQIQHVDGNRLWFSSPYTTNYKASLEQDHPAAVAVREVTLTPLTEGVDYAVTVATGDVDELVEVGAGNVVIASYTTDFVMPATYPLPLNSGPDLDESSGKWAGKSLVDGTYSIGIWSTLTLTLNLFGETNSYRATADANLVDFLVGSATQTEPYALISSGNNCFNCHQELGFHGFGRTGFESCLLCHGTAGSEDRPQYVAGNADETPGLTVNFRTMLHKIHMGEELANASSYVVNGFGSTPYPNNFTPHTYAEVLFPAVPGGVQQCAKCHGDGNDAWHEPMPRDHPTEQGTAVRRWDAVCGACHDSTDAQAHIAVQTDAFGNESCGVCHGTGKEWSVERVHKPY